MGIFKGSMSYVRFFAGKPSKPLSEYEKSVNSRAFVPLTPDSDRSIGWVKSQDPFGASDQIPYNDYSFGDLVVLTYRKDVHTVPKHIIREEVKKRILQIMEEQKMEDPPNKASTKAIEASVLAELRAKSLPRSKLVPVIWNTSTGEVRVFGSTAFASEFVMSLFERTFEVRAELANYAGQSATVGLLPAELKSLNDLSKVNFLEEPILSLVPAGEDVKPRFAEMTTVGDHFLTWLYFSLRDDGMEKLGEDLGFKEKDEVETVAFAIGPRAKLSTVDGTGAKVSLTGSGLDSNQELLQAVQRGALINLLSLDVLVSNRVYSLTLKSDGSVAGLKLPDLFTDPEEDSKEQDGRKAKRKPTLPLEDILALRATCVDEVEKVVNGLLKAFLKERLSPERWAMTASMIKLSLILDLGKTPDRSTTEALKAMVA